MTELPGAYTPPSAEATRARPGWPAPMVRSAIAMGVAISMAFVEYRLADTVFAEEVSGGVIALAGAAGMWFAVVALRRAVVGLPPRVVKGLLAVVLLGGNGVLALAGAALASLASGGGRGRQIRRFGRVLLPGLRQGGAWSRARAPIDATPEARAGLAAQWRENARTEHASVAAFARLTLDLMALGAPPGLVEAAHRDGLDEIEHARVCLSLASGFDGRHESPAPFPEAPRRSPLPPGRVLALAKLAVDSLVDGVLHEGVSARVIARLARMAEAEDLREALAKIAADEGRHAAHAWHVVDWCVEEGGLPVVRALEGALRALPVTRLSVVSPEAEAGDWQRWGVPGHVLEAEEYAKARAHVVGRVAGAAARCLAAS